MLKKGKVSFINYEESTVKVYFEDYLIETEELPVLQGRTKGEKDYSMPIIGEEGWCILENNSYDGVYLGGCYTKTSPPPLGYGLGISMKEYADGTIIKYDTNLKKMSIESAGDIEFIINGKLTGYISQTFEIGSPILKTSGVFSHDGSFTVTGFIKSLIDVIIGTLSLKGHYHTDSMNGNTTPPK